MSPKAVRAFKARTKLVAAEELADEAANEFASCVPDMHPAIEEIRAAVLQLRKAIEIARQTIKRIP